MENDYLHKISVSSIEKETNLTREEIAKIAGIKDPKNLGKWGQSKPDGSRPNYNAIIRLLQNGASVETLFGVEYRRPTVETELEMTSDAWKDPNFLEGFKRAHEDMKAKGLIK